MPRNVTRSQEPQSRLERLCEAMTDALEQHPEYRDGDEAIVMLSGAGDGDGGGRVGGLVTHGYDDATDAAADLLSHTEALFNANGMQFTFVPMNNPPGRG